MFTRPKSSCGYIAYMGRIEFESDVQALVHGVDENTPVARLYRLKDGWHAKLSHLHTGKAWFGPFDSAEQALAAVTSAL
jgi:hypothetical protein